MEFLNTVIAGLFSLLGTVIGAWLSYHLQTKRQKTPVVEPTTESESAIPHGEQKYTKTPKKKLLLNMEKSDKWWLGLSVFMVIEIVTLSIVNADVLGGVNFWFLPPLTIIFAIFAPVRWYLVVFYILLFNIATDIGYHLGGEPFFIEDLLIVSGIAAINVLICSVIVVFRRRNSRTKSLHVVENIKNRNCT